MSDYKIISLNVAVPILRETALKRGTVVSPPFDGMTLVVRNVNGEEVRWSPKKTDVGIVLREDMLVDVSDLRLNAELDHVLRPMTGELSGADLILRDPLARLHYLVCFEQDILWVLSSWVKETRAVLDKDDPRVVVLDGFQ